MIQDQWKQLISEKLFKEVESVRLSDWLDIDAGKRGIRSQVTEMFG